MKYSTLPIFLSLVFLFVCLFFLPCEASAKSASSPKKETTKPAKSEPGDSKEITTPPTGEMRRRTPEIVDLYIKTFRLIGIRLKSHLEGI